MLHTLLTEVIINRDLFIFKFWVSIIQQLMSYVKLKITVFISRIVIWWLSAAPCHCQHAAQVISPFISTAMFDMSVSAGWHLKCVFKLPVLYFITCCFITFSAFPIIRFHTNTTKICSAQFHQLQIYRCGPIISEGGHMTKTTPSMEHLIIIWLVLFMTNMCAK